MNHHKLIAAAAALAIGLTSTLAVAQPNDRRGDDRKGPPGHSQKGPSHSNGKGNGHSKHDDRKGPPQHRPTAHHHDRGPGVGPDHRFHRGDRLGPDYRHRQYVVNDWRGHHLHQPPRGHQWVQVGADYVLIAIATGLIAQIVLSR